MFANPEKRKDKMKPVSRDRSKVITTLENLELKEAKNNDLFLGKRMIKPSGKIEVKPKKLYLALGKTPRMNFRS